MDPVLLAIYCLAAGLCFTEGTILYFVLKLRQNSRRIENEIIPGQVDKVLEKLQDPEQIQRFAQVAATYVNEAAPKIIEETMGKFQAWVQGVAGGAAKNSNASIGKEALAELAAIDFGNPILNGAWAIALKTQGPKIVYKLGKIGRVIAQRAGDRLGMDLAGAFVDDTEGHVLMPGEEPETDQVSVERQS